MTEIELDLFLQIDYEKCTGCGLCEAACSFHHEKVFDPTLSRIKVYRNYAKGVFVPLNCAHCTEQFCKEACRFDAIHLNPETNILEIDPECCKGCKLCASACLYGGMMFNKGRRIAIKCNLCGGDPECEKFCPSGAITIGRKEKRIPQTLEWALKMTSDNSQKIIKSGDK